MWLGVIKYSLFCTVIVLIQGCASGGSYTPDGVPVTDFDTTFAKGEIRLNCVLACAGRYGLDRVELKILHNTEQWHKLAQAVSSIGSRGDQEYYYLGRAAEGLGYIDAAHIYYELAKSERIKCGGVPNVCDGFTFPNDIDERLAIIQGRSRFVNQEPFHAKEGINKSFSPKNTKIFNVKNASQAKSRESKPADKRFSISSSARDNLYSNKVKNNTTDIASNQNISTGNAATSSDHPVNRGDQVAPTAKPIQKLGKAPLVTEPSGIEKL